MIWQRDNDINKGTWNIILSNSGRFIKEARSKFRQYKVLLDIRRYYYTPTFQNHGDVDKWENCIQSVPSTDD